MGRAALLLTVFWALPGFASAQEFAVGDRVHVGSTNEEGTVIEVGPHLTDGGDFIKVHLDRLGAAYPNVGLTYDSAMAKVKKIGHVTAQPATAPMPPKTSPAPQTGPGPQLDLSRQSRLTPDLCRQLIRGNYPAGGDYTQTVNFLTFEMGSARDYEDVAANSSAGLLARGRHVSSAPVHAKFTVLKHYQDPHADDQLRTYDARYECFKSPATGWTIKMISRLPGGETAQYIHKKG